MNQIRLSEPGKIFPMFEFELKGGMEELIQLERELLQHLGFKTLQGDTNYPREKYVNVAKKYDVKELENEHEEKLGQEYGSAFFLTDFPNYTSPFWNMKQSDDVEGEAKKVDVIIMVLKQLVVQNVLVILKK